MTDHRRCARTWWLIANGVITHERSIGPDDLAHVEAGVRFERAIVESATQPDPSGRASRVELGATGQPTFALQTGLYRNDELRLRGEPDGIVTDDGSWAPIEVKHHIDPTTMDRLELAFYWLVLEPQRTDPEAVPHGYLILNGPGGPDDPVRKRIELDPWHLTNVRRLVEEVRQARTAPEPIGCGRCYVCRTLRPPSPDARARQRDDLHNLWPRADRLRSVGITSMTEVLEVGADEIERRLKEDGKTPGRWVIDGWVAHSHAWATAEPVIYGNPPPLPTVYTALDTEYISGQQVWLAGLLPGTGDLTQFFTWTEEGEVGLMQRLSNVMYRDTEYDETFVTYRGPSADAPQLRSAFKRTNVDVDLDGWSHFDLYDWVRQHLRLPVRSYGLKDVAGYLGMPFQNTVGGGEQAQGRYVRAKDAGNNADKARVQAELKAYNAEDLAAIHFVIGTLRTMYPQAPFAPPEPRHLEGRPPKVDFSLRDFALEESDKPVGWYGTHAMDNDERTD